jgi:hypothetical protein
VATAVTPVWDDVVMSIDAWLRTVPTEVPVATEDVAALRQELDAAVAAAVCAIEAHLDPDLWPVRLPKARLADLTQCERLALARSAGEAGTIDGIAALRGRALDHFVAHQLVAGRVREPLADLVSMLAAAGDLASLELLEGLPEHTARELLDPLAAAVADSWSGIDASWAPRVESRASVVLADRRVVCSGVIDVELGGVATGLPSVLVEVKSGRPTAAHQHEVYLYALLVACRDGVAPGAVARWYPGGEPAATPVSFGMLDAASGRLVAGARRWLELLAGDPPAEHPGSWCSWCPDAAVCPSAVTDRGGDHDG